MKIFPINRGNSGFTLLELMVVIVIIGIASTMAITSMDFSKSDNAGNEAKRLVDLIRFAIDESIITNSNIGFELTPGGYRFLRSEYDKQGMKSWRVLETDSVLCPRVLSDIMISVPINTNSTIAEIKMPPPEGNDHAPWPQIIFLSSGEITPFQLSVSDRDKIDQYRILGKWDGTVVLKTHKIEQKN
uniref:Type II secretion system protein H n=1 Tax=Candidatus Kentrum sp. SD TaxID=2126332 RepID=A0A450YAZ4_9GAMM|nr:MAG: type II secretion system protein H [Candidatus Kentron sp. SD]VFK38654.1 MAG: type II secretion system protein H [Candidatus Kentron sp. SD]